MILNLVMNAIEAMSSSQTRLLRIKTELSKSNKVHVSIDDTGTGIKPSDVARLFKPMLATKRAAWEWAFRSASQSLKTMAVGFGYRPEVLFSSLNCRHRQAGLA